MRKLQVALLQLTQSGVLLDADKSDEREASEFQTERHSMPTSWVRATMLVRCNVTARGHSAVTRSVLEAILRLMRYQIIPIVPLRGSVSASGDLMPLAYIAGALEGNPDVFVRKGRKADQRIMKADEALTQEGMPKLTFGPKEALGLVNGTAPSAALAALTIYDAHQLVVLGQAITAMTVEALTGSAESFHSFISSVRPHRGQIEASSNILKLLQGSYFTKGIKRQKERNPRGLAQDRYALRSAPQWIGPQLEDLLLAHEQVTIELNSSTDNPLIDIDAGDVYYGANFQAAAMTSAMEKTRLSLQMIGRLLFAQSTEMIDPNLNNGLPTNLSADDPSTSFTMKGVDINMAAYMSELAFLAGPVSNHVQPAEMHNQSINSLALLSARMTQKAVEVVSLMCAACLYVACQALDLRAIQFEFFLELRSLVRSMNETWLSARMANEETSEITQIIIEKVEEAWQSASRLDIDERCEETSKVASLHLAEIMLSSSSLHNLPPDFLGSWKSEFRTKLQGRHEMVYRRFILNPTTNTYLGVGSSALYEKIRGGLSVPFHQGLAEHPGTVYGSITSKQERPRRLVGSWISDICQAVMDGEISSALYGVLEPEPEQDHQCNGIADSKVNGLAAGQEHV